MKTVQGTARQALTRDATGLWLVSAEMGRFIDGTCRALALALALV